MRWWRASSPPRAPAASRPSSAWARRWSSARPGETEAVIARQLQAVLRHSVGSRSFDTAVIAYEPVWAIGTGRTATPEQAQQVHAFIRSQLEKEDVIISRLTRLLYGGSVKAANAAELFAQADVDGGLDRWCLL